MKKTNTTEAFNSLFANFTTLDLRSEGDAKLSDYMDPAEDAPLDDAMTRYKNPTENSPLVDHILLRYLTTHSTKVMPLVYGAVIFGNCEDAVTRYLHDKKIGDLFNGSFTLPGFTKANEARRRKVLPEFFDRFTIKSLLPYLPPRITRRITLAQLREMKTNTTNQ